MESQHKQQQDIDTLKKALRNQEIMEFRAEFLDRHPYDQAAFFNELDEEERKIVYHFLSPEEMAELFENIEGDENEYKEVLRNGDTMGFLLVVSPHCLLNKSI